MPRGHVALRILGLLGGGGDDVEADEREEHDRRAGQQAVPAVVAALGPGDQRQQRLFGAPAAAGLRGRDERRVVGGLDVERADDDHQQHDRHLDHGDHQAHFGRQLGAPRQYHGHEGDDQQRAPVQLEAGEFRCAAAEAEHRAEIARPALGHHRRGHRELQDQIPADDPGDELTERRVGERVGAARHRHRRGELGVAQRGQTARDRGDHERQRDRRAGDVARRGRGDGEDACADHHRDPEDREIPPRQVFA